MILDSEQAIIGSILMNPNLLPMIKERIKAADFTGDKNRTLYRAMCNIAKNGNVIEPSVVVSECDVPQDYLIKIIHDISTSADWKYHVSRMREARTKRNLLEISDTIRGGLDQKRESCEILSSVKTAIAEMDRSGSTGKTAAIAEVLPSVIESLEKGAKKPGIKSGFPDIDNIIGGWQNGELIIIAGRPGMGKSLIAKDFIEAAKVPALVFSLEMSKAELIKRQLAGISRVSFESIRTSRIADNDWTDIIAAANKLSQMPIFYNDSGNLGIDELCAIAETAKLTKGIGMVVIDYLQLIKSEEKTEQREREVANISRKLKGLARNLDIPVICLAQLNRLCEQRKPPMPHLSDLRESGAIEQDADIVGFLYRPWVYDKNADKHNAKFIIAKSRNTRTGIITLVFDGEIQVFKSAAREGYR